MLQLSIALCRSTYANVSHGPSSVQDFHTIIYFLFNDAVISDHTAASGGDNYSMQNET